MEMHVINMHFFYFGEDKGVKNSKNVPQCNTINLQIWKPSRSIRAIFIALWYYVSIRGVARLQRKLNAFIDIDF